MKLKRLLAALIDYYIARYIASFIFDIIIYAFCLKEGMLSFASFDDIIYTLALFLYLFKDLIFKNQSIGKKMLGLEVISENNQKIKWYSLILRNIFIILLPIEGYNIIVSNKRIGDIVFKTKVVENKKKTF